MHPLVELALRILSFLPALAYLAIPCAAALASKHRAARRVLTGALVVPVGLFLAGLSLAARSGEFSPFPGPMIVVLVLAAPLWIPEGVDQYIHRKKREALTAALVTDRSRLANLVERAPALAGYEVDSLIDILRRPDVASPEQLAALGRKFGHRHAAVRYRILANPRTPPDYLREAYEEVVAREARGIGGLVWERDLIQNASLPEDIIREVARHPSPEVWELVARNPSYARAMAGEGGR